MKHSHSYYQQIPYRNTSRGRSSRLLMIFKLEMFLNILQYSHRKTAVLESLCNNATGLKVCNFIRKRLHQKCFLVVNIAKFFKNSFFIEYLLWLLLKMSYSTPPQGFFIEMNVYEVFKFFILRSIFQYGNTWAIHLHYV